MTSGISASVWAVILDSNASRVVCCGSATSGRTPALTVAPTPSRRVVVAWREASAARPAIRAAELALREAWQRQADRRGTTGP